MSQIAIIIVSWNTRALLHRCIETIHASLAGSGIDYTIMVVDNASTDGTPAMLRAEHPDLLLLEAGRNLGFAGGNNLALRRVLGPACGAGREEAPQCGGRAGHGGAAPDYVLLLNPDTEIVGDAIPRLAAYLDTHPDVAIVGPQLRYPDGSIQSSRRRFPTPATFFWESTPLETYWPNNPWARHYRCAGTPDDQAQEVDWLVGAALLVRRSAIERAGLLDAGFTMYSEELEWQRRVRAARRRAPDTGRNQAPPPHRIVYLPAAVIIHHEGQSSAQAITQRYVNFQRSRLRYARLAYGAHFAALLRLFVLAAYGLELGVEALKWLAGHKRSLRAQRVRVYGQVLRALCQPLP